METIFLNAEQSEIKFTEELCSIKASMLFANTVSISPKDVGWIFSKYLYEDSPITIQQKIVVLERYYHNYPDTMRHLLKVKNDIKNLNKSRNKTKADIVLLNKITEITHKLYDSTIHRVFTLTELKEVTDFQVFYEQEFVDCIDLPDDEDTVYYDYFHNNKPHDLLLKQFNKKTPPPSVFVLPVRNRQYEQPYLNINDAAAANKTNGWYDAEINITGLNDLSLIELLTVREEITGISNQFNDAMNTWILNSEQDSWQFDDISYYEEQVLPIAKKLNEALIHHPILKPYYNKSEQQFLRIGAIPVSDIWHYYHQLNFIDGSELEVIKPHQNELKYKGRWPVLAPYFVNNNTTETIIENTDTEYNKRKFINLD